MKSVRQWSFTLFIVLVAILVGETEPIKQCAAFIKRYQEPLTWITGGMLAFGIVSLIVGMVILQVLHGVAMTRRDMEAVAARATVGARSFGWARIWGPFRGIKVVDAFSVSDLKAAWRSPALMRDPAWQRRIANFVGMIFTIYGAFSLGFVLAPPASVKLIIGVFVLGSLTQLARLIYRS